MSKLLSGPWTEFCSQSAGLVEPAGLQVLVPLGAGNGIRSA